MYTHVSACLSVGVGVGGLQTLVYITTINCMPLLATSLAMTFTLAVAVAMAMAT